MHRFPLLLILGLAACSTPQTVTREKIERVNVPVAVGCKGGADPAPVKPLRERYTKEQWMALTPKQKSELVSAQALRHQNYGAATAANTAGCK